MDIVDLHAHREGSRLDPLVYDSADRLAEQIMLRLAEISGSLSLSECRDFYSRIQRIYTDTADADMADVHYVNALKIFLEYNPSERGRGLRYFVMRFGSQSAQAEFEANKVTTRTQGPVLTDLSRPQDEGSGSHFLDDFRGIFKKVLARLI